MNYFCSFTYVPINICQHLWTIQYFALIPIEPQSSIFLFCSYSLVVNTFSCGLRLQAHSGVTIGTVLIISSHKRNARSYSCIPPRWTASVGILGDAYGTTTNTLTSRTRWKTGLVRGWTSLAYTPSRSVLSGVEEICIGSECVCLVTGRLRCNGLRHGRIRETVHATTFLPGSSCAFVRIRDTVHPCTRC